MNARCSTVCVVSNVQALANAIIIWYYRQHPWFQMDLPPYLQNPPEVVENEVRF